MDVKINQVILHILDAGASEPVLSDRPMELDADLYEYFSVCIEKAFASDDSKNCRFLPDSPFLQEMQHNDDFIDLSRRIAGVIFEQLLQYQGIPSGDLAVVDCAADGIQWRFPCGVRQLGGRTLFVRLLKEKARRDLAALGVHNALPDINGFLGNFRFGLFQLNRRPVRLSDSSFQLRQGAFFLSENQPWRAFCHIHHLLMGLLMD